MKTSQIKTLGAIFALSAGVLSLATTKPTFATTAAKVSSPYVYSFNTPGILQEAGSAFESTSGYWWVDSGASLNITNGMGQTNQGNLAANNPWRLLYAANNPVDTDNGYHPQNIFRLLTQSTWQNTQEQASFYVNAANISASPNRNESNALLLFARYQDHNDLYYAGVRVDGAAVIKKKQNGIYYTLTYVPNIFRGTYNAVTAPNLIPKNQWMGLRLIAQNGSDGSVHLQLFLDRNNNGTWQKIADTVDAPGQYGSGPITAAGSGGIRTDFMDVSFQNFRLMNM